MSIRLRINELVDKKNISKREFYKIIGVSNGFLDKEGAIGSDKLEQIIYAFPDINVNWLLTGEGDMFLMTECDVRKEVINGDADTEINISEKMVHSFNNIVVPIKASAGYFDSDWIETQLSNLQFVNLPFLKNKQDLRTFQIEGDSMSPTFEDGDYVVCQNIEKSQDLKSNAAHILVNRNDGIVLKRVINDRSRNTYLLLSDNNKYKPYVRHYDEIHEAWEVIYRLTSSFTLASDYLDE